MIILISSCELVHYSWICLNELIAIDVNHSKCICSEFALVMNAAADIILWRERRVSVSIVAGATVAWYLFEVAEYHFLSLACYLAMLGMLVVFIWANASAFFNL